MDLKQISTNIKKSNIYINISKVGELKDWFINQKIEIVIFNMSLRGGLLLFPTKQSPYN